MTISTDLEEHDWLVLVHWSYAGFHSPSQTFYARGSVGTVTRHFLSLRSADREWFISMRAVDTDPIL